MATPKSKTKSKAKTKRAARPDAERVSPRDEVIDALLAEAAAVGWAETTLDSIARRAGVPLGELVMRFPTKRRLLRAYLRRVDWAMARPVKSVDAADSPRDRLFEILMRRFDILQQHRDGVRAVITGVSRDPFTLAGLSLRLNRSLAIMLAAAGLSADGPCGFLRLIGLKAVVLASLRAWMKDDSADMAKTMAALDRALNYAERAAGFMFFRRDRKDEATAES